MMNTVTLSFSITLYMRNVAKRRLLFRLRVKEKKGMRILLLRYGERLTGMRKDEQEQYGIL
jgi:hypothetical protein